MTLSLLRSISAAIVFLCALPGMSAIAEDSSANPSMPQVVRGSVGNAKPAAPKPAEKPCVPTPEAKAAATVANGLSGTYAGTRYDTGVMSTMGAAVMIGSQQSYGCQR